MTPDQIEAIRCRVVADRRAQGLPDHVTDPAVLRRVAALVLSTNNGTGPKARSRTSSSPSTSPGTTPAIVSEENDCAQA